MKDHDEDILTTAEDVCAMSLSGSGDLNPTGDGDYNARRRSKLSLRSARQDRIDETSLQDVTLTIPLSPLLGAADLGDVDWRRSNTTVNQLGATSSRTDLACKDWGGGGGRRNHNVVNRRQSGGSQPNSSRGSGAGSSFSPPGGVSSGCMPNGAIGLFLSPNGDIYGQSSAHPQKKKNKTAAFFARPRSESNFDGRSAENVSLSSEMIERFEAGYRGGGGVERMKSVPLRGGGANGDPSESGNAGLARRRRTVDTVGRSAHDIAAIQNAAAANGSWGTVSGAGAGGCEPRHLSNLSKKELYLMWKASERALNCQLKEALKQKSELQRKLSSTERLSVT